MKKRIANMILIIVWLGWYFSKDQKKKASFSYPVFEDESQDPCCHFQKKQDSQEDGIGSQQGGVLPQRSHTTRKADDKGDGAWNQEKVMDL